MKLSPKDYVFANWQEAASHASRLFEQGEIDLDEYNKIQARAKREGASMPGSAQSASMPGAAPAQPSTGEGQISPPPQPPPLGPTASGRAIPTQPLPTWDQVQRFLRELHSGSRPPY